MAGHGYTDFGRVFDRLLKSRGHDVGSFAAECLGRGLKIGAGRERDVDSELAEDWMRGGRPCPAEQPLYADTVLRLAEEEWDAFGLRRTPTAKGRPDASLGRPMQKDSSPSRPPRETTPVRHRAGQGQEVGVAGDRRRLRGPRGGGRLRQQ